MVNPLESKTLLYNTLGADYARHAIGFGMVILAAPESEWFKLISSTTAHAAILTLADPDQVYQLIGRVDSRVHLKTVVSLVRDTTPFASAADVLKNKGMQVIFESSMEYFNEYKAALVKAVHNPLGL